MAIAACDSECGDLIRSYFADLDIEVHVQPWSESLLPTGYEELKMRCPHGVRWHAEPVAEQRLAWKRDNAP